jgi:hypothetical protein
MTAGAAPGGRDGMTCMDDAGEQLAYPLTHCPPQAAVPWLRLFPGEARQLRAMRQWLASLLGDDPARDDVTSIATELGGNAIRHTASGQGGWFAVMITWHQPLLRIAVADGGSCGEPQVIDDSIGEHGRGLKLVRGLSVRLGVLGDHHGRVVWADVHWDGGREPWANPGCGTQPASPTAQALTLCAASLPACSTAAPRRVVNGVSSTGWAA